MSREERFWAKVAKSDGCWEWTASCNPVSGYGQFDRGLGAHRVAYELSKGPIPDGLQLDHLCRNRRCVNPDHLEAVTSAENTRRGVAGQKIAAFHRAKTHCPKGHPYSAENTRAYKGKRVCKECQRVWARDHYVPKEMRP